MFINKKIAVAIASLGLVAGGLVASTPAEASSFEGRCYAYGTGTCAQYFSTTRNSKNRLWPVKVRYGPGEHVYSLNQQSLTYFRCASVGITQIYTPKGYHTHIGSWKVDANGNTGAYTETNITFSGWHLLPGGVRPPCKYDRISNKGKAVSIENIKN